MTATPPGTDAPVDIRCSFCNKDQFDVRKIVAGPGVNICDECVGVCVDILNDERTTTVTPDPEPPIAWPSGVHCSLCRMPVTLDDAIPVEDRGLVCRPCVTSVQIAARRRTER